uniref:STN domain-containing protein n=1 Tax=Mariniphaga sediminis TaxID=1628158 RepID=UPI0035644785
MKKNLEQLGRFNPGLKKLLLIMRLSILLILMAVFSSTASVYSQVTRLTIKMENARIADVFDAIENQSEFFFFYNRDYFNDNRIVSVDVKDKKIEEVLESLFKGQKVNYEILDRNILIKVPAIFPGISRDMQQQQQTISGRVTDSGGQPLPGVTVVVKGTTQGTITDANGSYSLSNIPGDATLVFSFVGMRTQEIPIDEKSSINVALTEETIGIDEVVAVGYGVQKKVNLTGAISSVTAKELDARPITNMSNALSGLATGVYVAQGDAQPGKDGATIRIRGV